MRNKAAFFIKNKYVLILLSVFLLVIIDFLIVTGITIITDNRNFNKASGTLNFNDIFFTDSENDNFYFVRKWYVEKEEDQESTDLSTFYDIEYESISGVKGVVISILYNPAKRLASIVLDKTNYYNLFDDKDIITAKNTDDYIVYADIFKFGTSTYMYASFKNSNAVSEPDTDKTGLEDVISDSEKSIGFFKLKDFDEKELKLSEKSIYNGKAYPYWYGSVKNRPEIQFAVLAIFVFQIAFLCLIFKKVKKNL